MFRSNDRKPDGGGRSPHPGRVCIASAIAVGLVFAVVGCRQTKPAPSTPGAGAFFRRVGPVSMLELAGRHQAAEGAEAEMVPTNGKVPEVPDSKIRLDIGMKLEEAAIADGVEFRVDDQRVVLEGEAPSYTARDQIEVLARTVDGVAAVENRLTVDAAALPTPDAGDTE